METVSTEAVLPFEMAALMTRKNGNTHLHIVSLNKKFVKLKKRLTRKILNKQVGKFSAAVQS